LDVATWNVNPVALKRVEKLFCKNERAVLPLEVSVADSYVTLVPVAAILVASIHQHFIPSPLSLRYGGATDIPCDTRFAKGEELGYFESGSTIVMFASRDFEFSATIAEGSTIRVGEAIFRHPAPISQPTGENDESPTLWGVFSPSDGYSYFDRLGLLWLVLGFAGLFGHSGSAPLGAFGPGWSGSPRF
jgi:hypothetical protein